MAVQHSRERKTTSPLQQPHLDHTGKSMVSINTLLQRHPKSKIANIHPIAQFVHSPKDVSPWLGNIRTLVYLPTTALNTHTHPPFEMNLRYNMGTRQKSFGPLQRSPLKLSINHKIQFKSKFSSNSFRSSYATVYHKTTAVLQLVPYCYRDPWDLIPLLSITGEYVIQFISIIS